MAGLGHQYEFSLPEMQNVGSERWLAEAVTGMGQGEADNAWSLHLLLAHSLQKSMMLLGVTLPSLPSTPVTLTSSSFGSLLTGLPEADDTVMLRPIITLASA